MRVGLLTSSAGDSKATHNLFSVAEPLVSPLHMDGWKGWG